MLYLFGLLFKAMFGWSVTAAFNLDAVLAGSHSRIEKKFQDNLSIKTAFMYRLKEQGGLVKFGGGESLKFPVIVGDGNAGSYYGDDTFNIGRPGGLQRLKFDVKQFYSTVRIDGIEEILNSGEAKAAEVLEGRLEQGEVTTINKFEEMLFGDGTGNPGTDGSARDWSGLQALVADDPTTGTIGGLSRATFSQLQNQRYTTAVSAFNTSQNGRNALTTLWADCVQGDRQPNFIVTTTAIWVLYQLSLTANERFVVDQSSKGLRDAGFMTTSFMTAPVAISAKCPARHLYMLRIAKPRSTGGIFLMVHEDRNFKMEPFIKPIDQDIRVAKVLTAGELCTDAPYLQGVATNITG